ncbi:hypothetical protein [Ruminiclostridium josui]|uniref:hypothetical protein n=1 Tax=Ruminiclostridium josui TaxID=1499 RepID=UPI0004644E75|nr:hypothetical protein [Ruminiclostridium josui]
MKNKILTATSTLLLSVMLLSVFVFASSYKTYFSFDSTLTGETRSFEGTNIRFTATAISSPFVHKDNKTYNVTLKRSNFFTDDTIGTVALKRDTTDTAKWSNVGKGKYYVCLSKAIDGVTLDAGSSSNQTVVFENY